MFPNQKGSHAIDLGRCGFWKMPSIARIENEDRRPFEVRD
jgi:hypothetical protein